MTFADGGTYVGQYANDERTGKGKFVSEDGSIYVGDFVDEIMQGHGKFICVEGWTYDGQWLHNMPDGQGKFVDENGDVYEGGFVTDMKHGSGVLKYADGSKYEGEFIEDEKCGYGKLTDKEGRVMEEGIFKDDVLCESTPIKSAAPTKEKSTAAKSASFSGSVIDGMGKESLPMVSATCIMETIWMISAVVKVHICGRVVTCMKANGRITCTMGLDATNGRMGINMKAVGCVI